MKEEDFYIDRKVSIWIREKFTIKGKSKEIRKKRILEIAETSDFKDEEFNERETLYETEEYCLNNEKKEIYEIFNEKDEMIYEN